MRPLLKLLGLVLLVIFVLWPFYLYFHNEFDTIANHRVRAFSEELSGINAVSVDKVKSDFASVEKLISDKNHSGTVLIFASKAADWLAFGLTAVITLISGYYGRSPRPEEGSVKQKGLGGKAKLAVTTSEIKGSDKRSRLIRIIGLVAALSSVSVALSARLSASSESSFKESDDLTSSLQLARRDLTSDKTTPSEAVEILRKLETLVERAR